MPSDDDTTVQQTSAAIVVTPTVTAAADVWRPLALQHLWNARHMAARCRDRENTLIAEGNHNIDYELRGLAMMAVASAAGFVETLINGVFIAVADPRGTRLPNIAGMPRTAVDAMAARWNPPVTPGVKRNRFQRAWAELRGQKRNRQRSISDAHVIDRYQFALEVIGSPKAMPKGHQTCQHVKTVIDLRNALLHYGPEWDSDPRPLIQGLLKNKKLPHSTRLAGERDSPTRYSTQTQPRGYATCASISWMSGRGTWV